MKSKASCRCVSCATCALQLKMALFHMLCDVGFIYFSSIIISRTIIQKTDTIKDRMRHKNTLFLLRILQKENHFVHFSPYAGMDSAWKDNEEIELKLTKKPVKFITGFLPIIYCFAYRIRTLSSI